MEYIYNKNGIVLYSNENMDVLPTLSTDSLDLMVTDPPYGIAFMGKDWDTFTGMSSPQGAFENKKGFKKLPRIPKMVGQLATGKEQRNMFVYGGSHSRGYKENRGMAEFFIPIWKECLRVLKPGAFAFIMCSPRQDVLSRQICNLQDAGFNTDFTSIYWAYAEGFPKAENIGKRIDKKLGIESKIVGEVKLGGTAATLKGKANRNNWYDQGEGGQYTPIHQIKEPISEQGKKLNGSYGGFQPKPAVEVIIVAMKPLSEKSYTNQALKNGKGITWLDDGRIPTSHPINIHDAPVGTFAGGELNRGSITNYRDNIDGRFPANLLVSDDILGDGKDCGNSNGGNGSYSRYFDLDKWWAKTFPFFLVSKPSKSEKNRYVDLPSKTIEGRDAGQDTRNVPQKTRTTPRKNQHPTVKPVKLMTYLISIGSRQNDIVLDPFLGSGTTAVSCQIINRKCIGIDNKSEYITIAIERLKQSVMAL